MKNKSIAGKWKERCICLINNTYIFLHFIIFTQIKKLSVSMYYVGFPKGARNQFGSVIFNFL